MFGRLVRKELLHHLLDFRFIGVFALCAVLSVLSVFVGIGTYVRQLEEYSMLSESNPSFIKQASEKNILYYLEASGYPWNRRPEVLSPIVFGLSGDLGREVNINEQLLWVFEDSLFSVDPIHALFEILDFAFIVKVILSLCVLLLVYDAVCGEKEGGTLRLYTSYPVSRSILALSKLTGSTIAVLVPFVLSFLLALVVMAVFPGLRLNEADWARIFILVLLFGLYLGVFAAFGLWGSALTHRRLTSFLGLLGLWVLWIFIVPNLAVRIAQTAEPADSIYDTENQAVRARWGVRKERRQAELAFYRDYYSRPEVKGLVSMSEETYQKYRMEYQASLASFHTHYHPRLKTLLMHRRNQLRRQQNLAMALSAASPLSALTFASMDLARTGMVQQERLEDALDRYLLYMARFLEEKASRGEEGKKTALTDFTFFTYRDTDTLSECLSRNAFHILNLLLLAVLGFAGAYVAILRYDVR